jgi:serine/threonine protein phosphatase PrpC
LAALQNPNVPAGRSGTTCIVCLLQQPKFTLHVAYVGDSRAILWNDKDDIATIAEETTTKTPSELDRIQQCQGRVDASGNVFHGPVGIAMTRALGDAVMLRAGVIPTPIVKTHNVNTNTRIVVATDGVFDVLTNNQVRQVVDEAISKGGDCEAAANVLAETAKQKWLGGLPIESKVDDITCIVVSL